MDDFSSENEDILTNTSFLYRNFLIYLTLSEETSFKYYQSLIVIFLSFIEILTAHLHSYEIYHVGSGTFLDYFITAFSYFDIFNVITLAAIVYNALFYLSAALAYLYTFAYISLLFTKPKKIRKNLLITLFIYFSKYYAWLLFFPSTVILSARILCPEHVFSPIQLTCTNILPLDDILSIFLAISGLICSIFMVFINSYFCYSTWYIKTDYFSTHYEKFLPIYHFVRLIMAVLMVIPTMNSYYIHIYLVINLKMGVLLLYNLMKYFPFSKFLIIKLFLFFIVLYISQTAAMEIDKITKDILYFNQSNIGLFMTVTFFTFEISLFSYFEFEVIRLVKSPEEKKLDFFELIKKIRILHYVSSSFNPSHLIYFRGILTLHVETCKNLFCFCKSIKIYDAKKGRELEISRRSNLKGVFGKYLIKNWFEDHIIYNAKDPRPSIFYADFLVNKMKNIHMALTHLCLAERKVFSFNDKRKILQFKQQIRSFVSEKNTESTQLGFEIIVFLEEQLEKLINLKRKFLKKSVKFWKLLENSFLNLTEMNNELKILMEIRDEITRLWIPLKPYLDSKKQLKFYYQWYLKNILNKKLKIADEEIKTLDFSEDEDFFSVDSKYLLNETSKNSDKLIYQHDCCVFHVKSNANSLGNIAKVNSGVNEVFEYTKGELTGSEITRIMTPFFSRNHNKYVEKFIKFSKTQVLYNAKYTFGLNKSGFIFPIWIIIKQSVDITGILEYIAMIKPLKTKRYEADYIILNEFGVIDGVSKGVAEHLYIKPEYIKNNNFNILLLSPKLVKFFTYEKYLKKDEEDIKQKKKMKKMKKMEKIAVLEAKKKNLEAKKKSIVKGDKKKWIFGGISPNNKEDVNSSNNNTDKKSRKSILKKEILSNIFVKLLIYP